MVETEMPSFASSDPSATPSTMWPSGKPSAVKTPSPSPSISSSSYTDSPSPETSENAPSTTKPSEEDSLSPSLFVTNNITTSPSDKPSFKPSSSKPPSVVSISDQPTNTVDDTDGTVMATTMMGQMQEMIRQVSLNMFRRFFPE